MTIAWMPFFPGAAPENMINNRHDVGEALAGAGASGQKRSFAKSFAVRACFPLDGRCRRIG